MSTVEEQAPMVDPVTWHRLDPRMLLVHPIIEVGRALPALVGVFLAGSAQGHDYWGLFATGIVVLASLVRWFTTRLRITADSVQLRHGLLRRRTVSAARDRIRSVDVTAHPLHRALGLVRLVIGTGTNDRSGQGRLVLDGLMRSSAARLRDELLHRAPAEAPAPDVATGAPTELARLDRRWIRYAPFTLSGVVTGLVVWGFYWRVQGESGVDLLSSGPAHSAGHTLHSLPAAAEAAVVIAGGLLFVTITSTAGYVLAYWGFRLLRHPGGTLQVTRGLLTTRATSIERRRLVGLTTSEPLPLRWVGAVRTGAVATGLRVGRGAERGGEVLLPPAPRPLALAIGTAVLDGSPAVTAVLVEHGPAARRRRLGRALVGGAGLCGVCLLLWSVGAPAWLVVVGAAAIVAAIPLGRDRYRNLGHAVIDGRLVTSSGSLVRRRAVLQTPAVIGWNLRSTWFQRRAGLATLTATTGAGAQGYVVSDVEISEALAVADAVTPQLLDQFRPPGKDPSG